MAEFTVTIDHLGGLVTASPKPKTDGACPADRAGDRRAF